METTAQDNSPPYPAKDYPNQTSLVLTVYNYSPTPETYTFVQVGFENKNAALSHHLDHCFREVLKDMKPEECERLSNPSFLFDRSQRQRLKRGNMMDSSFHPPIAAGR